SVVVELLLGIVIGPHVLGWASIDDVSQTLAQFGLAMLIFLAGFEVDIPRVRGRPLNLAVGGWLISLVLGITVRTIAVDTGFALSGIAVGLCLTSTTIGTLLPMLRDRGELETRFGVFVLAAGAMGEIGPILAISLLFGQDAEARTFGVLLAFALLAVAAA